MSDIKPQFDSVDLKQVFKKNTLFEQSDFLHREILMRQIDRLSLIKINPKKILVIDQGFSEKALQDIFPEAQIDVFSDLTQYFNYENNSIDFIFSNLYFHFSPDPEGLFKQLSKILKPNGLLMFSMLGPDTLKELRFAWGAVDQYKHIHDFYDLHDVGDSLMRTHFSEPVMDMEQLTITYKNPEAIFSDLKNTNSVNILSDRRKTLTGKKRFQHFLKELDTYKKDNKIPLTFEIIYGHAWGSFIRKDGEIEIPLSALQMR